MTPTLDQSTLRLYKNVLTRKARGDDRAMVKECLDVYSYFNFRTDDVVLDLGVNVGGFAAVALQKPIAKYIGVEADPENMAIAKLNVERLNPHDVPTELLLGAASASKEPELTFAQTESGNAKCSGSIVLTSRNAHHRTIRYQVKNYNLEALFAKYKPTIVKMDIEGAEWDWLDQITGLVPDHVREIAFDLHGHKGIQLFDQTWLPMFKKNFKLVNFQANTAFEGNKALTWEYPGFGIKGTGRVYALDVFFKRK